MGELNVETLRRRVIAVTMGYTDLQRDLLAVLERIPEIDRLREKVTLLEMECAAQEKVIENSCGCVRLGNTYALLPPDFIQRWKVVCDE